MGVSMSQPKPTPRTASGLNIDPRLPPLVFGLWLFGILVLVLGISRVAPIAPGESRRLVDWAYLGFLFRHVNPYLFTAMGIASSIGLSVLGAAWCVPPTIAPASPPTLDAQIHRESSAVFLELQFANIHPSIHPRRSSLNPQGNLHHGEHARGQGDSHPAHHQQEPHIHHLL